MDKRNQNRNAEGIKEHQVTYEMYAEMPEDGHRYEIIDGVLKMMTPGATTNHQTISRELGFHLMSNCKNDYLLFHAPLDVMLSPTNVVQPDLLMIHRSRLHLVTKRGVAGAPDLVVEILSPGSRKRDRMIKQDVYAEFGVPEYWIVDPETRTLEQYQLDGASRLVLINLFESDERITSDKLPCVSFEASEIFRDLID